MNTKQLNKLELKLCVQDALLLYAGNAFNSNPDLPGVDNDTYRKALQKEYKRIQKIFGYPETGWTG